MNRDGYKDPTAEAAIGRAMRDIGKKAAKNARATEDTHSGDIHRKGRKASTPDG